MIHSPKPGKVAKKFIAECRLQPGEICAVRSPISVIGLMPLLAQKAPGLLALTPFNAAAHEIPTFHSQGQVLASIRRRTLAKRAKPLVDHGVKALNRIPYLAKKELRQEKALQDCNF